MVFVDLERKKTYDRVSIPRDILWRILERKKRSMCSVYASNKGYVWWSKKDSKNP